MATEHIPHMGKLLKDCSDKLSKITERKQADIEGEILRLRKLFESEEKSMLHNVTVKHEENKVLEKYWLMRAIKDGDMYGQPPTLKRVISEQKLYHEPTPHEIAQLPSDSKADFVSVVQNYRFESELPF